MLRAEIPDWGRRKADRRQMAQAWSQLLRRPGPAGGQRVQDTPRSTGRAARDVLLILLAATAAGGLVAVAPTSVAIVAGVVAGAWLLAIGPRVVAVFHVALVGLLVGYAFLGKGFAYFGVPPLYVGEMVLAVGVMATLHAVPRARLTLPILLLGAFMAWGVLRTVPYIGTYGLLAVRDGVTWGYGLFAIAIALTVQRHHVDTVVAVYRRLLPLLLVAMPVAALLTIRFAESLPRFPGSPVAIPFFKAGDNGVHLAGIAAFILLGLYAGKDTAPVRQTLLWLAWFVAFAFATLNRGAILAISAATACVLFARSAPRLISLAFVTASIVVALVAVNPTVDLGINRSISAEQFITNFTSILATNDSQLEASKQWRLLWWDKIVSYTVEGPYFWTGKGFGINLATVDGFQVNVEEALRAPHSSFLEILARAGVPGLALWVLLQAAFAISMLRAAALARRIGEPLLVAVIGWVFVYWLAALINGAFDVYLGGPQGGIWFWSMFGFGLALTRIVAEQATETGARGAGKPPVVDPRQGVQNRATAASPAGGALR